MRKIERCLMYHTITCYENSLVYIQEHLNVSVENFVSHNHHILSSDINIDSVREMLKIAKDGLFV